MKLLLRCENIEKQKNNSGVLPTVTIKQSSSTHSSTPIVRVETPLSSYGGTRSQRFGVSVGGLSKAMNDEQILQSSNPLATTSSSFHSRQGRGQLVVLRIKVIQDILKKDIHIVTLIFDFADNILYDNVISICLDRIIGCFGKNCECSSMLFRWKNFKCVEEEKILTILIFSLMDSGDKTFDLEFMINCDHFGKNIKMASNRGNETKKSKRKYAISKKTLSIQASGKVMLY